jgi:meso-butanediol dehydrogenase/(S,S)-butanediol dehydrogenase/diacetyl reductase
VCGRRHEPLRALAEEIGALAIPADTREEDSVQRVVDGAVERFGRLDGLVVAAGVGASGTVGEQTLARWQTVIDTNLTGAFLACRAAIGHLLDTRGSIVTIASLAGLRAGPESAAYCSSKAAMVMLTQCIALDYGPAGLRANCVCPGWIRTAMADGEMDELAARRGLDRQGAYKLATAAVPARREGNAEEVAAAVSWLLSPQASYVNGAVLTVDGGAAVVDAGSLAFQHPEPGQRDDGPGT